MAEDLVWQPMPLDPEGPLVEWTATTTGALRRVTDVGQAPEYQLHPWLAKGSPFAPWSGDPRGISCHRRGHPIPAEGAEQLEPQPYESEEEARAFLRSQGVTDEFLAAATRVHVRHEKPMKTKPCKDCGAQVSKRAKKCPACGAPAVSQAKAFGVGCLGLLVLGVVVLALLPAPEPEDPAELERERLAQEEREAELEERRAADAALAAERTDLLREALEPFGALVDVDRSRWLDGGAAVVQVRAGWHDLSKADRTLAVQGLDRLVHQVSGGEETIWDLRDPLGKKVAGRGLLGLSAD